MPDIIKGLDPTLLVLLVLLLGGYFIWSVKTGLRDIKDLIKELFEDRNEHEDRIKELEVRCNIFHGVRTAVRKHYIKPEAVHE